MLSAYINAAMGQAKYETIENGDEWGEIPGFAGLRATGPTIGECVRELRSTRLDR